MLRRKKYKESDWFIGLKEAEHQFKECQSFFFANESKESIRVSIDFLNQEVQYMNQDHSFTDGYDDFIWFAKYRAGLIKEYIA